MSTPLCQNGLVNVKNPLLSRVARAGRRLLHWAAFQRCSFQSLGFSRVAPTDSPSATAIHRRLPVRVSSLFPTNSLATHTVLPPNCHMVWSPTFPPDDFPVVYWAGKPLSRGLAMLRRGLAIPEAHDDL